MVLPMYSGAELYRLSIWKCPETCRVSARFYGDYYSKLVGTGEVVSICAVARPEELFKMCGRAFRGR